MKKLPPEEYYKTLPRKRMASAVLILNEAKECLIVKLSYKDHWSIPGGVTEESESPAQTAIREAHEEIGVEIEIIRLLCVDYMPPKEWCDSLQWIFAARLKPGQVLVPDGQEIEDYRYSPAEEALTLLNQKLAKRLAFAFKALQNGQTYYLENGENPFGN